MSCFALFWSILHSFRTYKYKIRKTFHDFGSFFKSSISTNATENTTSGVSGVLHNIHINRVKNSSCILYSISLKFPHDIHGKINSEPKTNLVNAELGHFRLVLCVLVHTCTSTQTYGINAVYILAYPRTFIDPIISKHVHSTDTIEECRRGHRNDDNDTGGSNDNTINPL